MISIFVLVAACGGILVSSGSVAFLMTLVTPRAQENDRSPGAERWRLPRKKGPTMILLGVLRGHLRATGDRSYVVQGHVTAPDGESAGREMLRLSRALIGSERFLLRVIGAKQERPGL